MLFNLLSMLFAKLLIIYDVSQRLFYILHLFKAVHFIRITRDFYRVYFMLINKDYLNKLLYIIYGPEVIKKKCAQLN